MYPYYCTQSLTFFFFFTWDHWCSQIQKVNSTSKNEKGNETKMKGKPQNILYKNIPYEGCSEKITKNEYSNM